MSEQQPTEPSLVGDILNNQLDEVMNFQNDPVRQEQVHQAGLTSEQAIIQAEIDDLWGEIQAGRAGVGAQERLDDLKQALLSTDADLFEARSSQDVNPPQ